MNDFAAGDVVVTPDGRNLTVLKVTHKNEPIIFKAGEPAYYCGPDGAVVCDNGQGREDWFLPKDLQKVR